jgi:hypothetical protein
MDQIVAKVSGMSGCLSIICGSSADKSADGMGRRRVVAIQVGPGESNKGIFVRLSEPSPGAGEVSANNAV